MSREGSAYWVVTWLAIFATIAISLILWVSTIPEPAAQKTQEAPGRLSKPPGRSLTGFAEARGLPR
jgi:hypothetical protein